MARVGEKNRLIEGFDVERNGFGFLEDLDVDYITV
jgi:hypothetical protein